MKFLVIYILAPFFHHKCSGNTSELWWSHPACHLIPGTYFNKVSELSPWNSMKSWSSKIRIYVILSLLNLVCICAALICCYDQNFKEMQKICPQSHSFEIYFHLKLRALTTIWNRSRLYIWGMRIKNMGNVLERTSSPWWTPSRLGWIIPLEFEFDSRAWHY